MLTSVFFMYLISVLHGSMSSELDLKKNFFSNHVSLYDNFTSESHPTRH